MDIYIALVVSAIFILQLWKEVSAAERRKKIIIAVSDLLSGIAQGLEEQAKGETDEQGTDPG